MAKKSKSKKRGKKSKKGKFTGDWCMDDLHFDAEGNLCIVNEDLSKAISKAIYKADRRFCIRINCKPVDSDQPGVPDTADSDGGGSKKRSKSLDGGGGERPPANAMCPC